MKNVCKLTKSTLGNGTKMSFELIVRIMSEVRYLLFVCYFVQFQEMADEPE